MSFALFRSCILLIVLCMFMILIDETQSDMTGITVTIPKGCKIIPNNNNKIVFPSNVNVKAPETYLGHYPEAFKKKIGSNFEVYLPVGFSVIMSDGFYVKVPIGAPSTRWYDKTSECTMTIPDGWNIFPIDTVNEITIEGSTTEGSTTEELSTKKRTAEEPATEERAAKKPATEERAAEDDIMKIERSAKINALKIIFSGMRVTIPKGCKIIPNNNNKIVFPSNVNVKAPKDYIGHYPEAFKKKIGSNFEVYLPEGWSVIMSDGFHVKVPFGVPVTGWFDKTSECTMRIPAGYNIVPTVILFEITIEECTVEDKSIEIEHIEENDSIEIERAAEDYSIKIVICEKGKKK